MQNMNRKPAPERLAAFSLLENETLYSASQVADLAEFEGTPAEKKQQRRNFRATLGYYYRPAEEPDDFVQIAGQGGLHPAWLGKTWKKSAGMTD